MPDLAQASAAPRPRDILLIFLRLGFTCFGGPIAHLGYFRAEFVERRRWLTETAYADLIAVAQFLPGPASSQVGFAIGLLRGGLRGALAAWAGFTLPSAVLLLAFAYGAPHIADTRAGAAALHGLKLAAVAIVAQAVLGMARTLCPDRARASIATLALMIALARPGAASQIGIIELGVFSGLVFCRAPLPATPDTLAIKLPRRTGLICIALFVLLLALAFLPTRNGAVALFDALYRAGALVFGGGHVVLPLLRTAVVTPGWIAESAFLSGYGAAQAVPGPLFTFAAYLGAAASVGPGGVAGAAIALVAIFLPGLLALLGVLPFWHALRARPSTQAAMRGVNAAVVGLLAAALYNPVWTSAVGTRADVAVAATGFVLLVAWRAPPLLVVTLAALAGILLD